MDLACVFKHSRSAVPGAGTSSRVPNERLGFGRHVFGEIKLNRGSCSARRRKGGPRSGQIMLSSTVQGTSYDYFNSLPRHRSSPIVHFLGSQKLLRDQLRLHCQANDSLAHVDGDTQSVEDAQLPPDEDTKSTDNAESNDSLEEGKDTHKIENLRELLQKTLKELEVSQLNSTMFEEKAQSISETAIALKDEAENAWKDVTSAVSTIQEIINEETAAKEAVQKATMALSLAEARLKLAAEALNSKKELQDSSEASAQNEEEEALLSAEIEIKDCQASLSNCEDDLKRIQTKKAELQKEVDRLSEIAEKAQLNALKAEEDVASIMLLAEQAVALELEATQRANDAQLVLQKAEITLQKEEKAVSSVDVVEQQLPSSQDQIRSEEPHAIKESSKDVQDDSAFERDEMLNGDSLFAGDVAVQSVEEFKSADDVRDQENGKLSLDPQKESEPELEKSRSMPQAKKSDVQHKDLTKDSTPLSAPKALLKKSSRFFSASFFSFDVEDEEFTPRMVFHELISFVRKQAPKLVVGILFLGMGAFFLTNREDKSAQLLNQPDIVTGIEEVTSTAKPVIRAIRTIPKRIRKLIQQLPHQEINEEEASLFDMLWLLLASVIFVPIFQKIPGGSPVLGYLAAGILIGPYGLSIIRHVHGTKAIAEFGVVFLLFNIGLELSVERLSSMKKYVFGLGSAQVLVTATVVGLVAHFVSKQPGPAAIVIGNGLALSSTAVVLQVLQERGESTSRHGRATFSVLLFQDLAVVVLLILIPLISPNSSKGGVGFQAIAEALGMAAVKAIVAIAAIIAGGRLFLRPIYKQIAENQNAEIFSANTLLVILGTSLLTARAGLSMALGAFLAGLLLAETEFSLQVESDIAPYRGLLLGLFFMTVGMSIDPKLLFSNFPVILGTLSLLIVGKTILVALVGRIFGISSIAAIRVGLLLAPGGEFAFVAFGEAVNQGILSPQLSSLLFLVVGISMALTPWLAAGGQLLASRFEQHDVRSLLPVESETDDLQDHIIICGFGRVGQIIAQLLSERLIPFVALDVRSDRVAAGRALDLPVYFGDAGSREVLHKVGAERACAAAITLDTPGANYRTVWALSKYFPNVKTFVRAHDVDHGVNLEKAGATAVVPETLEPSLQLAAAVLAQAKLPMSEIAATINEFRSRHLSELTELCATSGSSLGYGYSRVMFKPKSQSSSSSDSDENDAAVEGTLAI
ncbi:K(+) efflux antiporter 2, chloroplastic [Ananas comosus]|uniref:K(+) efflux antiporter 2, chloroplastic n=2 Tax=Ananas comosus TaxID=4615 RepID=A0A6P5GXP6_ANACO|nr:K(+) efflux antiporter 2, chloroplastic [Ananas comosus]XP_020112561.1 K(+) efflux antiporter 2, chloroplastic [Ananas comosus]XP_020112562.1 K(+) efflux antiporter 2, chloroplastic [Ananas comosus]